MSPVGEEPSHDLWLRSQRAPVADDRRPSGVGPRPPGSWPTPKLDGPLPGAVVSPRRSGAFMAFAAFLVGALVVGAAFATYAFGDRRGRTPTEAVASATGDGGDGAVTPLNIREILDTAEPSVVTLTTGSADSIFGGTGSGVIISEDGLILTNAHVVAEAGGQIEVRFNDGTTATAEVVGASASDDVALLQASRSGLTPAVLGSSANLRVGDDVVAIGNALALGDDPSVTKGIVSAKNRSIADGAISLNHLIQTDAAINPGNSGGPLLDSAGEVVGINTAIIQGAQSVGFAIEIDEVERLLPELKAGGGDPLPETVRLGVATIDVDGSLTDDVRNQYGVTASSGALITAVEPDSAASSAGILEGDVVVEADGQAVATGSNLQTIVRSHKAGDRVPVVVERQGRRRVFDVTLGD